MGFLQEIGIPIPKAFYIAAEFALNLDLKRALEEGTHIEKIQGIVNDIKKWNVPIVFIDTEFIVRHRVKRVKEGLYESPSDLSLLHKIRGMIDVLNSLPFEINLWQIQNIYYKIAKITYREFLIKAKSGDTDVLRWIEEFKHIGQSLFFNIGAILQEN